MVLAARTPFRALQVAAPPPLGGPELLRERMNPLLLVRRAGERYPRPDPRTFSPIGWRGVIVTSGTPSPDVIEACNRAGVPVVMIQPRPAAPGTDDRLHGPRRRRSARPSRCCSRRRRQALRPAAPAQETYSVRPDAGPSSPAAEEAGHIVLRPGKRRAGHASGQGRLR